MCNSYTEHIAERSTHWHQIKNIPDEVGVQVLELGCNTGYIGRRFRHARFFGVEYLPSAAAEAAEHYAGVQVVDLNRIDPEMFTPDFPVRRFTALLAGDVLEHLLDPVSVLRRALIFVEQGGPVVISLPNVANVKIRLKLLAGRFDYTETGILDRTHLHLFTRRSALDWFGHLFDVERVAFGSSTFGRLIERVPRLGPLLGNTVILIGRAPAAS